MTVPILVYGFNFTSILDLFFNTTFTSDYPGFNSEVMPRMNTCTHLGDDFMNTQTHF